MHAFEPEAPRVRIEREQAAVGDQRDRPAGAMDVVVAAARRADEGHLRHQRAAANARCGTGSPSAPRNRDTPSRTSRESARSACSWIADADQVDVAFAVDLAAGEEEHVDAALAGAVEQLAPAVGEEGVLRAAEQRHVGLGPSPRSRGEQRRGRRDRRGIADRDVPHVADQVARSRRRAVLRRGRAQAARRSWTYWSRYFAKPSSVAASRAYSVRCSASQA